MNLIDEDEVIIKPDPGPKRKVLLLIALCVFLLIIIIAAIIIIKKNAPKKLKLFVNNSEIKIADGFFLYDEEGKPVYVSIEKLARLTKYDYISGTYIKEEKNSDNSNDKVRCYIQGDKQIIGFEEGNRKVYKTEVGNKSDVLYFQLSNAIRNENGNLYIALVDLNIGYNVVYSYDRDKTNVMAINTLDYETSILQEALKKKKLTLLVNNFKNQKAMLYNMIIIQNEEKAYGVTDISGSNQLIVNMYTDMQFDDYTKTFIVANKEKKYGIVDPNNKLLVEHKYDSIELVSYSPLLYRIEQNKKFGLIDKNGKVIISREFDKIGIANREAGGEIVLIKGIGEENLTGVVVCMNQKYGILNLKNGDVIVRCVLDKIYYKELNNGDIEYYVEANGEDKTLNQYLIDESITTVTIPQQFLNRKSD